ncbi:Na+/phosphate symporter [Virgibacillus halotolerans]|uniref:hypothetical protein n=1 Tax=Virgibacillus halotolerans TaxID=1071053 RepID=UPI00195FF656|nr:hypothetical protein [Virgibacillus halotolerans]MBM7598128.1 Na+/phosphate symporter [Virgibacillus halotolerans]
MEIENVLKVVDDTIEQMNKNAMDCLQERDRKNAKKYMQYADGIRMVKDNIEFNFSN